MSCSRILSALLVVLCFAVPALAGSGGPGVSPDQALDMLKQGNARFVAGKAAHPNLTLQRLQETAAKGQKPFATVLACSDSREPVELLFDQGVGDVFVIRVAGNVSDVDEVGSIEYGVGHLGAPLLVVLGHTQCGAVTAVATDAKVGGSIPQLVDNIAPAVARAKTKAAGLPQGELVEKAVQENVWQSIADAFTRSEEIRRLVSAGKLKVVGAVYDLGSGAIEWMGAHPDQAGLLK
ncbi:MAG: carbonic anhydrase [Thermodesulfobacteriota bacterium]